MTKSKRKKRLKCAWVKGHACRYPERIEDLERMKAKPEHILLACIACLFGWHLELSELKKP